MHGRDEKGQFLPGVSGNPRGRPKGRTMQVEIERQLEEEDADGRSREQRIVTKLLELAEGGDMRAAELVLKRVAPEKHAVEVDNSLPLLILRDYTGGAWRYMQPPGEDSIDAQVSVVDSVMEAEPESLIAEPASRSLPRVASEGRE